MEFKLIQQKIRETVALKFDNYFELKDKTSDADSLATTLSTSFASSITEAGTVFESEETYML